MNRLVLRPLPLVLALSAFAALLLAPLPGLAGPTSFDLPRLDFGAMAVPTSRACTETARPGAATACTPAK